MLGLHFYALLSCIIQLHVAKCKNESQPSPATPTSAAAVLTSTTVQSSIPTSLSSPTTTHSNCSPNREQPTSCKFFDKGCNPFLLLIGGLIIACTVLILSTLVLAWKVCLLSKRASAMRISTELDGQTECGRWTAAKKSSRSETEIREGSTLTADHLHEGEEGTEEQDGTAKEDKAEKAEEAAKREEASPAPTANSSSPVPQEEPAKADSTSEGTEKPKDEE